MYFFFQETGGGGCALSKFTQILQIQTYLRGQNVKQQTLKNLTKTCLWVYISKNFVYARVHPYIWVSPGQILYILLGTEFSKTYVSIPQLHIYSFVQIHSMDSHESKYITAKCIW